MPHLLSPISKSQFKTNHIAITCHMISLYENTVTPIKWIDMKSKKKSYNPTLPLSSQKYKKNGLCEMCLQTLRQVLF